MEVEREFGKDIYFKGLVGGFWSLVTLCVTFFVSYVLYKDKREKGNKEWEKAFGDGKRSICGMNTRAKWYTHNGVGWVEPSRFVFGH